jgi:hypothetical protein
MLAKGGCGIGWLDYLGFTITERKVILEIHRQVLEKEQDAAEGK